MEVRRSYSEASERTVHELKTIAEALDIHDISKLSLPQIEEMIELVGKVAPAGDIPGVILSGLARIKDRHVGAEDAKRDTNMLLRGVERMMDNAVYGTFFMGPAAVIWGYQNLLKLAGKNPEDYFPEGYWQFYIEYALREDTARHSNETHGFDTTIRRHQIHLSDVDRATAWVMAAVHCLHRYEALLRNEWRERVYIRILNEIAKASQDKNTPNYSRLYREWERQRPYRRGVDVRPGRDYASYRRIKFDQFLERAMVGLPDDLRRQWLHGVRQAKSAELTIYLRQMSILAYLNPTQYGENRVPLDITDICVGIIRHGHYYLIPVCKPGTAEPIDVTTVRTQLAAIMQDAAAAAAPATLAQFARVRRAHLPAMIDKMSRRFQRELEALQTAPILFNMDKRPLQLDLAEIRQAERGIGSHAMTIFDTGQTFVFDQSHIFFDGTWGAAFAEIFTNEAISWGVYLNTLPPIFPLTVPPRRLRLAFDPVEEILVAEAPKASMESSAETAAVNLRNVLALRRIFKLRSDLIQLTVNDLLVLYRAIHAFTYRPAAELVEELTQLKGESTTAAAAELALRCLDHTLATNPPILIPVDASQQRPTDRLHPMTFHVPIHELGLLETHPHVVNALNRYKSATLNRDAAYAEFDELQRTYLTALAGCGLVFAQAKKVASQGESASVGTIKLLAHLPVPLQRFLDKIPARFELLNDIIKGREVFSNIGAVATNSSLLRFMSAKDDNELKDLTWGVLSDVEGVMRITLRDFRPHVAALAAVGREDLAKRITQDYLDAYARGFNDYVRDLRRIAMASRETRLVSDVGMLDVRDSR